MTEIDATFDYIHGLDQGYHLSPSPDIHTGDVENFLDKKLSNSFYESHPQIHSQGGVTHDTPSKQPLCPDTHCLGRLESNPNPGYCHLLPALTPGTSHLQHWLQTRLGRRYLESRREI